MKPRLVLFEFHQLGDVLLSFPFVRAAMAEYEVWVCCRPQQVPVFSWVLPTDRIVAWEPRPQYPGWAFPEDAKRAGRWDAIRDAEVGVCAWADPRPQKLMRDLGIKERVGLPISRANYFTDAAALEPSKHWPAKLVEYWYQLGGSALLTRPVHRADRLDAHLESWHRIAEALRMTPEYATPWFDIGRLRLGASSEIQETIASFRGEAEPRWAIHPGARLACRRWARENWEQLIEDEFGRGRSRNIADTVTALLIEPPGETWAIKDVPTVSCKSIDELAIVLDSCTHLLAHDSFPAHLAAALGKRVVALFGDMPACWFAPFDNAVGVVGGKPLEARGGAEGPRAWRLRRDLDAAGRSLAEGITVEMVRSALKAYEIDGDG